MQKHIEWHNQVVGIVYVKICIVYGLGFQGRMGTPEKIMENNKRRPYRTSQSRQTNMF